MQFTIIVYFSLCKGAFLRRTERARVIVKAAAIAALRRRTEQDATRSRRCLAPSRGPAERIEISTVDRQENPAWKAPTQRVSYAARQPVGGLWGKRRRRWMWSVGRDRSYWQHGSESKWVWMNESSDWHSWNVTDRRCIRCPVDLNISLFASVRCLEQLNATTGGREDKIKLKGEKVWSTWRRHALLTGHSPQEQLQHE